MKQRLDQALVERGLVSGRDKAKALVMAGEVRLNGQRCDKAGTPVAETDTLELISAPSPYVSRGGEKLAKALKVFPISPAGLVCADFGASTGGFTDCLLQNGAEKVYAVDVGYGQLAYSLRIDERVVNLERTNVRTVTPELIPEPVSLVTMDLAFISILLVLKNAYIIGSDSCKVVCLVKPQFEAGRSFVGKNGVVREASVHRDVLERVTTGALACGFSVEGLDFSPIKGPKGNIEYLMYLQKGVLSPRTCEPATIAQVVAEAHSRLDKKEGASDADTDPA